MPANEHDDPVPMAATLACAARRGLLFRPDTAAGTREIPITIIEGVMS